MPSVKTTLVFLTFDPSISPHYKLVGIRHYMYAVDSEFLVFSSETCQWKRTNDTTKGFPGLNANGVYYNGSVY